MVQNRLLASFVVLSSQAVSYLWNTLKLQDSFLSFFFLFWGEECKMVELHWISAEPNAEEPSNVTYPWQQLKGKASPVSGVLKKDKYKAHAMVSLTLIYYKSLHYSAKQPTWKWILALNDN